MGPVRGSIVFKGSPGGPTGVWTHDGVIEQQVEMYDSGVMLAYDRYQPADEFGRLAVEPLDVAGWMPLEIVIADYQRAVDGQPLNRL